MICSIPNLFVQSERCGIQLVLLPAVTFSHDFLTQYASHREAKKNNHHLLTVKIRQNDSLKSYIGYFQSQLAKVFNCGEDVSALAFIRGCRFFTPCISIY